MSEITVGIEIETSQLPQVEWEKVSPWTVVTDGSIRTEKDRNREIITDLVKVPRKRERFGAEIVSPVLVADASLWDTAWKVVCLLKESGEVPHANTSIHVHVGFSADFTKYLPDAWAYLKDVDRILYSISAPGDQIPRGVYNNFLYYRPLDSPQIARDGGDLYRPSIGNVYKVKTKKELKFALGRKDITENKWYPARYCGINLVALFNHSTLEFRHFNFTSDFLVLKAWVYLCIGIVKSIYNKAHLLSIPGLVSLGAGDLEESNSLMRMLDSLSIKENYPKKENIYTHTGKDINWFSRSDVGERAEELIPDPIDSKHIISVRNPHPDDYLAQREPVTIFLQRVKGKYV